MPKSFYANEADVPADQKGCYEAKNGRWELTHLDADHPVVATNKSLTTEQAELKRTRDSQAAQITNLEQDKAELLSKSVPRGYRAVKTEVAEIGEAAQAEGLTADSLKSLKTENDTFKTETAARSDRDIKTKALKSLGVDNVDGFFALKASDAIKIESETVDGKEKFFAVTETNGVKEKKAFDADFFKNTNGLKDLSLTQKKEGFSFAQQTGDKPKGLFDRIREETKAADKTEEVNIDSRFGKAAA